MKNLIFVLAALVSLAPAANADSTTYYWGFADNATPEGKHSKMLVVGHRIEDEKKEKITDTQLYGSAEEGFSESSYEFDFKSMKMTSLSKGKRTGGGTFKCDGTMVKHTSCSYSYATDDKKGYRSEGKDFLNIPGVYYREESNLFMGSDPKPVVYTVDLFAVDKKFYTTIRAKLLKP